MAGGMVQVVEHLLRKPKAMSSNPNTIKKIIYYGVKSKSKDF
jgi:hypothetical protein